jgi:tetratricopeptide (TPR) repeat protein
MIRPMRILFVGLFSVLVLGNSGFTAETKPLPQTPAAPSAEEWEPIRQAVADHAPTAQTQLLALERRYPTWVDGTNALAGYLLEQGKAAEALVAAKRASQLAPTNVPARRIQVRALADLGRKAELYTLVDSTSTNDPAGWIRYEAGLAAVGFADAAKAEIFLTEAKSRVGSKIPSEFLFLESRVALLTRDFARAELALVSATTQQPNSWDGWYELGRVRLVLADQDRTQATAWISKANAAFTTVCKALPKDPHGHLGLGRALLAEGITRFAEHENDQAGGKLRAAIVQLNLALALAPNIAETYVVLGDAQLRLEQWTEAATSLQRAKELGAKDRSLLFNLAIALQQTGKNAEAQALLANFTATTPGEQITLGMGAYRSRHWLMAVRLLEGAVEHLDDAAAQGATWRYIGHAYRHLADDSTGENREKSLDSAQAAYFTAGDLVDFTARHFHLGLAAERSPEQAYAAGWQSIHWDALNIPAWGLVIGSYGQAKTGGHGLSGMANRAPLHLALWSALFLLPLAFFGLSFRQAPARRTGSPTTPRARAVKASVPPAAAPTRSPTRTPAPIPRQPARPTPRPEPNAKDETAEIIYTPAPPQKTGALAVRTPLPSVKPGVRQPTQVGTSAADQTMLPSASADAPGQALERRRP